MDLLWTLLTLPYAPVRGLTAVVKVIAREAESQQRSPVSVRRDLEELDAAAAAGEISAEERDRAQQAVLDRLTGGGRPPAGPAGDGPWAGSAGQARRARRDGARRDGPDGERRRRVHRARGNGAGGDRSGGADPRGQR